MGFEEKCDINLENFPQLSKQEPESNNEEKNIIDFIMVYDLSKSTPEKESCRRIFESNLVENGLILETDESHQQLRFVKIRATRDVLCRYTEIMKIRMPMKHISGQEDVLEGETITDSIKRNINKLLNLVNINPEYFIKHKYQLTAEFTRNRLYLFDINDPDFFPQSIRICVVAFILEREKFSEDQDAVFDFGIARLLANGTYKTVYPLHNGEPSEPDTKRFFLKEQWAKMKNVFNYQPIDKIKDYFGVKFALYFLWLGFYTFMLIPVSVIGVICFLYAISSLHNDTYSNDICDKSLNITMCPQCSVLCDYWKLDDACLQSKITYLFDNDFTVFFAVVMSLWSSLYLEFWKRYSAEINHKWHMTGFNLQAEHPRPEYLVKLADKKMKLNVVTQRLEPSVPFWTVRIPYMLLSYSVVLFLIILAFTAVFGIIIYRMALSRTQVFFGYPENRIQKDIIVPVSAAVLNLILITILNKIYDKVAVYLTDFELLRTQTEVDDSLTLKIFLFQFVNYYSSIFYIAFFKGKFVGHPSNYNKIFGIRQEECSPGGCFHEIFIQLFTIMVGRKILSWLKTIVKRLYTKYLESHFYNPFRAYTDKASFKNESSLITTSQWKNDYCLLDWPHRGLFDEYLEMVLQYGFVTIFVAAFPLAPLCALIANILEIRMDAMKFLKYYRRPITSRSRGIGVWYNIMDIIGRLSVLASAIIIGFTSNFIPRLVYTLVISPDQTQHGFLNHSLSYFDTNDFESGPPASSSFGNVETCRYRSYREPYWEHSEDKYAESKMFWHITVARLAFIIIFQNVVTAIRFMLQWIIPDVPRQLGNQMKREAYLTNEIIIKEEDAAVRRQRNSFIHVNLTPSP